MGVTSDSRPCGDGRVAAGQLDVVATELDWQLGRVGCWICQTMLEQRGQTAVKVGLIKVHLLIGCA